MQKTLGFAKFTHNQHKLGYSRALPQVENIQFLQNTAAKENM